MTYLALECGIQSDIDGVAMAVEYLESESTDNGEQCGGLLNRGFVDVHLCGPRRGQNPRLAVDSSDGNSLVGDLSAQFDLRCDVITSEQNGKWLCAHVSHLITTDELAADNQMSLFPIGIPSLKWNKKCQVSALTLT